MTRLAVPLYTITLILSAFLLFSVQPLFAKMILPLLGGSPSVWNIAMVFFQAMLLGGYAYAHGTSRHLGIRPQAILHLGLLILFTLFLPFALPAGLTPSGDPALWQIGVMLTVVGAPFFIISASAPMIQHWFSASGHKDAVNPYFLYAASNIGSMAALLSYPVIVEPGLTLKMQTFGWADGYWLLIAMTALCAAMVWNRQTKTAKSTPPEKISSRTKIIWMSLAFIPSSLMLGVTTYITTDLASIPLLWIIPLSLYLLTFILVFARRQIVTMDYAVSLFSAFMVLLLVFLGLKMFDKKLIMIFMHLAAFFFACLLCHKKLADMRPAASNLTGFYMYMSLGGVLGGMFNALLAPVLFVMPIEYSFALCATLFVRGHCFAPQGMKYHLPKIPALFRSSHFWLFIVTLAMTIIGWLQQEPWAYITSAALLLVTIMSLRSKPLAFAVVGSVFLLIHANILITIPNGSKVLDLRRNFFGVLQVNENGQTRNFYHGTTLHGAQPLAEKYRLMPVSYYNPLGPLGDVFGILDARKGPQKIGVLGLGVGTVACYGKKGRSYDFYEIDADVVTIAENKNLFTYLSDCGSPYTVKLGDGRLKLDEAPDGSYDLLIIDAFSSDNIPMHLLTLEAFRIYMKKVKAGGMIVINISNRFLDLKPQIAALSAETFVPVVTRFSHGERLGSDSKIKYATSLWVAFSPNPDTLIALRKTQKWHPGKPSGGHRLWTDDYANLLSSLMILQPRPPVKSSK